MNIFVVLRSLSQIYFILGGMAFLCGLIALSIREITPAIAFALTSACLLLLAAILYFGLRAGSDHSREREGMLFIILFWITSAIISTIPFLATLPIERFVDGIFEAMSCLTTTGISAWKDYPDWPVSLIAWRAMIHFLGAVMTAVSVILILTSVNKTGLGIQRSRFFHVTDDNLLQLIPQISIMVALVYGSVAFISTIVLIIDGFAIDTAIWASLSAVTTGLVHPNHTHVSLTGWLSFVFMLIALFIGSANVATLAEIVTGKRRLYQLDIESKALLLGVLIIFILLYMTGHGHSDIIGLFIQTLSVMSTSGLNFLNHANIHEIIPMTIMLMIAIIGGSALSGAGGIKLARILAFTSRMAVEFQRLGHPSSVKTFYYRGVKQTTSAILGIWAYIVAYMLSVLAVQIALSLLGIGFEDSFASAVGTVTSSGHLITDGVLQSFRDGNIWVGWVLLIGMFLGRIEILVLFAFFVRDMWE